MEKKDKGKSKFLAVMHSFRLLWQYLLWGKRRKVLFYYPQHFNRSASGNNPFFAPLTDCCEKAGIPFLLVEEPAGRSPWSRNLEALPFDWGLLMISLLRFFFGRILRFSEYRRERAAARVFNILTLGRFRFPVVITIANAMVDLFALMNPRGTVCDFQHGVIHPAHAGYFRADGKLLAPPECSRFSPNVWFLVYGEGFREIFFSHPDNESWRSHVLAVGNPNGSVPQTIRSRKGRLDAVLFSLQFTGDSSFSADEEMIGLFRRALRVITAFRPEIRILYKHHPRFRHSVDLSGIEREFPNAEETHASLEELASVIGLQITFASTTVFEYGLEGIPTWFMDCPELSFEIYYSIYHYPLYRDMPLEKVLERLESEELRSADSECVRRWCRPYFEAFNAEKFITFLKMRLQECP